jgi:membrane-associated protease RseP (regulator of RpoE activity)
MEMLRKRILAAMLKPLRAAWWRWQNLGRWRNVILFLLTVMSTLLVGLYLFGDIPFGALLYSGTLLTILLAHEMGHFLMSRKNGIPASLPFFIPFLPPFGTLGAIIKMRGSMTDRRALFDIAVAGPLAGFIFTVPAIIIGLKYSAVLNFSEISAESFRLGDSILFLALSKVIIGTVPEGYDIFLHPMAYAGWIGLYVMALNLLPIGQLDGGHVIYALLGEKSRWAFSIALALFALIAWHFFRPWLFLIGLIVVLGLIKHPAPRDQQTPLNLRRKLIGIFVLILFILSFSPVPFPDIL